MKEHTLGRLLIVDDEIELTTALVDMLKGQGYESIGVTSGKDALEQMESRDFDVLLTDLMMPGMDGIELLRSALEIDRHLVVVIMTGHGTVPNAVEAMKSGAFDYILKPFKMQVLLPILRRAMDVRRLRMENVHLRETLAIYELGQTIAHTLDRDTLLNKTADAALQQLEADEVSLMFPTQEGNDLYVAAVRGNERERVLGARMPMGLGIAGWVAHHRTPLTLDGEVKDPRFAPFYPRPDIGSAVSMPMVTGGKLVGVLNVSSRRRRPFTLGQVKGLSILAGIAAAALEGVSLYNQLRQAEEKYRSIFENAVEGIFQSTPDGCFITANPALARILGYETPDELIETVTNIGQQLYVEPREHVELLLLLEERGSVSGYESRFHRKDGRVIWVSRSTRIARNEAGALYHEGTLEDITERKRSEEALRESRELLHTVLNSIPVRVFWKDGNLVYLGCNMSFARDAGLERPEDLIGKDDHAMGWREQAEVYRADDRAVIESGEARLLFEEQQTTPSGERIHLLTSKVPLRDAGGEIVGVLGAYYDITARKQAEEDRTRLLRELGQLAGQQRLILESTDQGIFGIDLDRNCTFANRAAGEMFGYPPDELTGKDMHALTHHSHADGSLYSAEECPIYMTFRTGQGQFRTGEVFWRSNGEPFHVEYSSHPIRHEGELLGTVVTFRDVTERLRAEESQRRIEGQLQQAQRLEALGTLAGGIAHDFNNILGIMYGYTEMALSDAPDGSLQQGLEEVLKAGRRARDLVKQILAFSRMSKWDREPMQIGPIVKETVKLLRASVPANIEIVQKIEVSPAEDKVLADPTQIHQILMNLCTNSAHAMREKGDKLEVSLACVQFNPEDLSKPPELEPGAYLRITVSDNGQGMDRMTTERIFEPYFTTKGPIGGTGLGLSVVHGIVKSHKGAITVHSEPGMGTTIQVFLPGCRGELKMEEQLSTTPLPVGNETILLVDDEKSLVDVGRQMLERLGYTVVFTSSSMEALEVFRARPDGFDLVFTDQSMPKMTGLELAGELMRIRPDIPIILCTGFSEAVNAEQAKAAGIVDFIMKPVVVNEMAVAIRRALDKSREK